MIEEYLTLADRIEQELLTLNQVTNRAKRAIEAARQNPADQDLYMDSAALNLHDFYAGIERILQQIGATVDGKIPSGNQWHQQLLRQMQTEQPDLRPPVLSETTVTLLDEYLRFRHVVRNVYAFEFDPTRLTRLVNQMQPTLVQAQVELTAFTDFLRKVGGYKL